MLTSVLLIAQLIACGDSDNQAAAPPPPPPAPAAPAPKPEPAKKAETADGAAADGAAAKAEDAATENADGAAAEGAAVSMEGTKVASKKEQRKFASSELKAADKDKLIALGQQMLVNKAKKGGYTLDKSSVKLIKAEKKKGKGGWTGIAQGEGSRTVYTYAAGNQVTVKQDDKSKKDAIIKSVSGSEYAVTYADGSEATVKKSALQPR